MGVITISIWEGQRQDAMRTTGTDRHGMTPLKVSCWCWDLCGCPTGGLWGKVALLQSCLCWGRAPAHQHVWSLLWPCGSQEVAASGKALSVHREPLALTEALCLSSFLSHHSGGSCLPRTTGLCGNTLLLCFYSGVQRSFLYKFTVENNEKTKIQSQQGPRDLPASWVLLWRENTRFQTVTRTALRSLQGGIHVFSRNTYDGPFKKLGGLC